MLKFYPDTHWSSLLYSCLSHLQYHSPRQPVLAVLQTTSYNFTGTNVTEEICAGVVKPTGVFPKNPAQHSADFELLEQTAEVEPAFINPITGIMYTSPPNPYYRPLS